MDQIETIKTKLTTMSNMRDYFASLKYRTPEQETVMKKYEQVMDELICDKSKELQDLMNKQPVDNNGGSEPDAKELYLLQLESDAKQSAKEVAYLKMQLDLYVRQYGK
jgi:hypothetical protein